MPPEMNDVVTGETISESWGNSIRDRSVQRYATVAERTTESPSPTAGDLAFMEDTGNVDVFYSAAWRHVGPPVGAVTMLAGGSIPTGWLLCNGQAVSRTTYATLFATISTTWGAGNGTSTFNVPDFRGRVPRGVAASGTGDAMGEEFGTDSISTSEVVQGPNQSASTRGIIASGDLSGDDTIGATGRHTHTVNNIQAGAAIDFIIRT